MRRTIVIGDVHGCAEELEALLLALKLQRKDRVYQVGDLINRGPENHRTIELAKTYDIHCILGNHEVRLLQAKQHNNTEALKNGDLKTFNELTEEDWAFLENLPPYIHKPKLQTVIVHAGFMPEPVWNEQDITTHTQIRAIHVDGTISTKRCSTIEAHSWAEHWKAPPFVVYGHNARFEVFKRPGSICIDTSCVYGGHLTDYIVEDQSIVQVPATNTYA